MYLFLILFITYSQACDCKIALSDQSPNLILNMEQFDKGIITLDIISNSSANRTIKFYQSNLDTEDLVIIIILLIIIALLAVGAVVYGIKFGYCCRKNPEQEHLYGTYV